MLKTNATGGSAASRRPSPKAAPRRASTPGAPAGNGADAIALVQSPAIRNLQFLDLGNNDLTDVTGLALAESPHAGSLQHIELGGALLEPRTEAMLKRRFGSGLQLSYPWARGYR